MKLVVVARCVNPDCGHFDDELIIQPIGGQCQMSFFPGRCICECGWEAQTFTKETK